MSTATYKVVFLGRLVDGYSEESVKSNLARAFKLGPQQLTELFSGKEVVIKAGLPIETARQVQTAFVRQGVVTLLRKVADGDATIVDEHPLALRPMLWNGAESLTAAEQRERRLERREDGWWKRILIYRVMRA